MPIQDIWGAIDPYTGEEVVLCVASNLFKNQGVFVLNILNNGVTKNSIINLPWGITSIWFESSKKKYVVGDGIFVLQHNSHKWEQIKYLTRNFSRQVRGTAENNILICGDFGDVLHFNGITWKKIHRIITNETNCSYSSISLKNNRVAITGTLLGNAIINVGKK